MSQEKIIIEFLQKERKETRSLQYEFNRGVGEKQVMIISQKREFFWRIAALALGLSGGITFFYEETIHKDYFYFSLIFFALVVIFSIFWTREVLDSDGNNLQKLQDKYNIAIEEKIKLIDKFTEENLELIKVEDFFIGYSNESKKMASIPLIVADVEELEKSRKNRGTQNMDYSGECIVFLFMSGVLFLVFSLVSWVNWYLSIFIMLLIFSLSFSDNFLKIISNISKIALIINKKSVSSLLNRNNINK